jgi:cytochrome c-type biogenesis protein CcsB
MCLGSSDFYGQIEKLYYYIRIFERLGKWFLLFSFMFLSMNIIRFINKKRFKKLFIILEKIFQWTVWVGFSAFTSGLLMRWFLAGHAPWSNQYECMVFAAWSSLLAGIILSRHSRLPIICGSLLAGIVLLIAHTSSIDPSFTPLPPVLKSKLMVIHVSIAMASYGFFSVGTTLALCNLSLLAFPIQEKDNNLLLRISKWSKITEQALWIGLLLITLGSIIGSIWANEAWGRYWGWDPKESWTLILILSYAMVLQLRLIIRSDWTYWLNVWTLFAFGTLLMTYLGVNRFFAGMHTYGGEGNAQFPLTVFWIIGVWFVLSLLGYRNRKYI